MRWFVRAVWIAAPLAFVAPAEADGDPVAGKAAFNRCKACHEADKPANKVGPSLLGLIGRTAGTLENFNFSKAMKEAGAAGLVWSAETLTTYLKAPKAMVPGTSMAFAGMKDDTQIADLIAYLSADPKP